MQQPVRKTLSIAFWLLCLLDITAIISGFLPLHYIVKPLLVPVLILVLFFTDNIMPGKKWLITGLAFSWAGDVSLLFETKLPLAFIIGLVCFLTTHIFYIIFFLRIRSTQASLLKKNPFLFLLVIAYGAALVWLLYPHLGDLRLPVMVYALVICAMLLASMHAYSRVSKPAGNYYCMGATAFVLSDSLLAINKFYQPFAFAGALIMLSYCAAQYFIVRGFVGQE